MQSSLQHCASTIQALTADQHPQAHLLPVLIQRTQMAVRQHAQWGTRLAVTQHARWMTQLRQAVVTQRFLPLPMR